MRHHIIFIACVLIAIATSFTQAQIKSYSINYITSDVRLVSNSCKLKVTEQISVDFVGQYNFMGRVFPNRISYGTIFEGIVVSSNDVQITNRGYVKSSTDGTSTGIVWDFVGLNPASSKRVVFTLDYTVTGMFQTASGGVNKLYWSYQWDVPVTTIDAKIYLPFGFNSSSITTQPTARSISDGVVWFETTNLPRTVAYDTIVTLPTSYGEGWNQCKHKPATFLQKIGIIIAICIIAAIFICCCVLCSIWGAIRRGLFWGDRFGYGGYGGYNNGYYHSGGGYHHHHHHSSSSGSGNVGSYSGSSGFAG